MEKMPYLKSLGITAVELLPVQEFNETSVTRKNPQTGQALKNYWGYDPVVFLRARGFLQQPGRAGPPGSGVQRDGAGFPSWPASK